MPARRKAASGKKSTGQQKRAMRKTAGPKSTDGRRPTAAEIREKTPTSKKKRPARDSVTARRKRKTGVADSAITAPKPRSNKTTAKKKTIHNKGTTASSSGQKPAVRKRAAAPQPTRARRNNAGGKAGTTARSKNTPSKRSDG